MSITHRMIGAKNYSLSDREVNDFYATDPRSIDGLFSVEDFSNNIWEPAAGAGHLVTRMQDYNKNVYASDLIDRGTGYDVLDFLTSDKKWDGDIITNPPFKYSTEFIYHSLDIIESGAKVAMFLKLQFLETKKRRQLFDKHPPKIAYVYSKRIGCERGANLGDEIKPSALAFMWVIWEKGWTESTILGWI